ncbi:MAG: winged helix-turn-helix transcriptional regulator [Solirubrobacterales bacterium]
MALGAGPLRTEQLTTLIQDFSPRSVYRQVSKMREVGLIDRHEEPGVPSKVLLSLSEPAGRELFHLLRDARVRSWSSLNLLAELWELGFIEELSREPRSLTQLASTVPHMTYHQVNRRIGLFLSHGLLLASPPKGHRKRYNLSDLTRHRMALIAALGRWQRHLLADRAAGLTIAEMATVLRASLPLPALPQYVGMTVELTVWETPNGNGQRITETLQGTIDSGGRMCSNGKVAQPVDGSAAATVNTWLGALLDGKRGRIQVRRDLHLVDSFLRRLYDVLWEPEEAAFPSYRSAWS